MQKLMSIFPIQVSSNHGGEYTYIYVDGNVLILWTVS